MVAGLLMMNGTGTLSIEYTVGNITIGYEEPLNELQQLKKQHVTKSSDANLSRKANGEYYKRRVPVGTLSFLRGIYFYKSICDSWDKYYLRINYDNLHYRHSGKYCNSKGKREI